MRQHQLPRLPHRPRSRHWLTEYHNAGYRVRHPRGPVACSVLADARPVEKGPDQRVDVGGVENSFDQLDVRPTVDLSYLSISFGEAAHSHLALIVQRGVLSGSIGFPRSGSTGVGSMKFAFRVIVVAIAFLLVPTGAAVADCGPSSASGSGYVYKGPSTVDGATRAYASWNKNQTKMHVDAAGFGMGSGKCVTSLFDWATSDGDHYDARVARTCKSGAVASGDLSNEAGVVNGVQKFGACYAPKDQQPVNSCEDSPLATPGCTVTSIAHVPVANKAVRWWNRTETGAWSYVSGGDRREPNS